MDSILLFVAFCLCFYIRYVYISYKNPAKIKEEISQLEGKNFFCYNNITDPRGPIEVIVIPQLSPGIEVIFLDGKDPVSEYDKGFIKKILYRIQRHLKTPNLFKVRNGELTSRSINNEFFTMLDQNKPVEDFLKVIDDFFEIKTPPDTPV